MRADTTADKYAEAQKIQAELERLSVKIQELSARVASARQRTAVAAGQVQSTEAQLQSTEARAAAALQQLRRVAIEAYIHQSGAVLLSQLLEHGLGGPRGAAAYVTSAISNQRKAIARYQAARTDLSGIHTEAESVRANAQAETDQAVADRREVEAAAGAQKKLLEKVTGELADLVAAEAARKAAAAKAAAAAKPPPTPLPGGTALTPSSGSGSTAGRQAGAERSNTPPPTPTTTTTTTSSGTPTTTTTTPGQLPVDPNAPAKFVTFRVFATQYNPLTSGSVEVAVPDKCVKWAALGSTTNLKRFSCSAAYTVGGDYRVMIRRESGQTAAIPVKDVGPWNIDDNYWAPASSPRPRRMFNTLDQGKPQSQAAFYSQFNSVSDCQNLDGTPSGKPGGADQFNRCVLNPSGIDVSPAAAALVGLPAYKNEWVTVTFLWEPKA